MVHFRVRSTYAAEVYSQKHNIVMSGHTDVLQCVSTRHNLNAERLSGNYVCANSEDAFVDSIVVCKGFGGCLS